MDDQYRFRGDRYLGRQRSGDQRQLHDHYPKFEQRRHRLQGRRRGNHQRRKASATFTNASTINADFSGQIGDVGNYGSNDLTFHNSGTVVASGSGVKLTINTGSHAVVNGASATIEAEGGATVAIVSNLTNQGTLDAGPTDSSSTGTLDLGTDGGTESMTDTGGIGIYGGSDLAISGKYTITGSGTLYLKGAGADITSDGKAATFTNASTIEAGASGQIGDSDLTFVNTGAVVASAGSGQASR